MNLSSAIDGIIGLLLGCLHGMPETKPSVDRRRSPRPSARPSLTVYQTTATIAQAARFPSMAREARPRRMLPTGVGGQRAVTIQAQTSPDATLARARRAGAYHGRTTIMSQKIGLYGGSFNPIHNGHLIVARAVAERLDLERLIFLPSANPPHKETETLAASAHRAEMVRLAIEPEPAFEFSDFDLTRKGPSYTIDTVAHFRNESGAGVELCWIIGADSLVELPSWHRAGELVDQCRIVTAVRPGWTQIEWDKLLTPLSDKQLTRLQAGVVETPMIEISSSDIRQRVTRGRSIRYLVPNCVRAYVETHRLYR